ncbi:FKBP-type peptidyl-prolyl cis-trans isomerase [Cellulomonas composti]|uniref:peptidylprolyl isomerase n=1 Tax=Cellulomonas composti TaxID=266130 RepID=A0A511J829_9CELL|nr:FKBP-type peptidyl-prolyl cis-trans isomerase [Cellulomonas composti]GEL94152.1 peptidylprolyl isomerase [Cellulomonas composti]
MPRSVRSRALTATSIALALILGAAACSGDDDPAPTPTATATAEPTADSTALPVATDADMELLSTVEVTGDAGVKPTITLPSTPFAMTGTGAVLLADGDGAEITDESLVQVHITAVDGADGTALGSTFDEGATAEVWPASSGLDQLDEIMIGAHEGARILLGLASGDATQVYVVDLPAVIPPTADGTAVAPDESLPVVTVGDDGVPVIAAGVGEPPTELVVQPLIQGDGDTVEKGDDVVVQYVGALWDGTVFDSSWANGQPLTVGDLGSGSVVAGWEQGLEGQQVGSRVLLVIPPELGYKDVDQGSIPANSTLVFVVDILKTS